MVRTSAVHPELVRGTFMCMDCSTIIPDVEQQFRFTEVRAGYIVSAGGICLPSATLCLTTAPVSLHRSWPAGPLQKSKLRQPTALQAACGKLKGQYPRMPLTTCVFLRRPRLEFLTMTPNPVPFPPTVRGLSKGPHPGKL